MHLAFDIFQGIGIAAALGIRPFLPSLAVGALAAGDVEIHFKHTSYHFLQGVPFLIIVVVLAVALAALEARRSLDDGPLAIVLGVVSVVLGALFFAGSLARGGYSVAPGIIGGVVCAGVAIAAARPFLARLRGRLDAESAGVGVPLIAEGSALLTAILSVVAPPLGVIALLALLWLLWQGRGREEQKYAGLRILR
ncbi:MAG TPA: DUF4126 family protein [Solirubrobacteraceae bacterium]|nr:DUF4126 family protein [Solirubrobacteraceae bacterium]